MPRGYRNDGQPRQRRDGSGPVSRSAEPLQIPESRFSINQRFGFIDSMVGLVTSGEQASVIICGPGGLGKSHSVIAALNARGFVDRTLDEDFSVAKNKARTYTVIKGYSTSKGLYRTLWENKDGVIVFDDCDSVLKDPVSLSLLKTALDSYGRRVISWRADFKDDELPNSFLFKGRVVFISNMASHQMDQAILTRSLCVDLSMTTQQKVERMRTLLQQQDFLPDYSSQHKQEAMDLIDTLQDTVKELSLRTLIQCVRIRKSSGSNWAELAEYAICG